MEQQQAAIGRPRGFDDRRALEQALGLFWDRGYLATSLDDLTRGMGIRRSSFYAAFGSKHEALLAALRLYCDAMLARLQVAVAAAPDPEAALAALLRAVVDPDGGRRGCFLLNCLGEIALEDAQVDRIAQDHLAKLRTGLKDALGRTGRANGPEAVDRVLAQVLGLVSLRKFGCPAESLDAQLTRFRITIQ
jgi:TetR/AcrR family transcriptional regulator, transcriptional repressor for nem operon